MSHIGDNEECFPSITKHSKVYTMERVVCQYLVALAEVEIRL